MYLSYFHDFQQFLTWKQYEQRHQTLQTAILNIENSDIQTVDINFPPPSEKSTFWESKLPNSVFICSYQLKTHYNTHTITRLMLHKHKQTKTVVQSLKSGEICWKFKIFNNTAFKMSKRYGPMLRCVWMKETVCTSTQDVWNRKQQAKSKNRTTTWSDCNVGMYALFPLWIVHRIFSFFPPPPCKWKSRINRALKSRIAASLSCNHSKLLFYSCS